MQLQIDDEKRIVVAWLTSDEDYAATAQPVIDQYRGSKYKVVVIRSGKGDLIESTCCLLRANRGCD